jgi:hypothetical protein
MTKKERQEINKRLDILEIKIKNGIKKESDAKWVEPKMIKGIPQIPVDVVPHYDRKGKLEVYLLQFYCCYCKKIHQHGGGNDIDHILYGNRGAHCHKESSPFIKTGYNLIPKGLP